MLAPPGAQPYTAPQVSVTNFDPHRKTAWSRRLRDECLNARWFRVLNDVRHTLEQYRQKYKCERPHSALAYRTPREFSLTLACGDVESKERFQLLHRPYYDCELYSQPNRNRETPVTGG
jgi:putative transposase